MLTPPRSRRRTPLAQPLTPTPFAAAERMGMRFALSLAAHLADEATDPEVGGSAEAFCFYMTQAILAHQAMHGLTDIDRGGEA
jgi:hypothetical protein